MGETKRSKYKFRVKHSSSLKSKDTDWCCYCFYENFKAASVNPRCLLTTDHPLNRLNTSQC